MKKLLALLLVVAFALSAVACSSQEAQTEPAATDAGTTATDDGTQAETPAGDAAAGDKTLLIGVDPDYSTFDPAAAYEGWAAPVMMALYDTLFRFDAEGEPQPWLVEDYTVEGDGTVYTFKLREDVDFSSGNHMTSADVKFSLDRIKNLQGNPSFLAADIQSVETPDDYTVVVTLGNPDGAFIYKLGAYSFGILDSAVVMENGGVSDETAATADNASQWLTNNSAGSGPYTLASYSPDSQVVLERNDNYWAGPADAKTVTLLDIPDATTQAMMIASGDLDVALGLNADQVSALEGNADVELHYDGTLNMLFLLMNNDPAIGGPMADPKVQQAVRYAVDYAGIQALCGPGSVTPQTIIQVGFFGALEARSTDYTDKEKAKALLAEAGYPDGFEVTFSVITNSTEGIKWLDVAQKVAADLAEVGITANIETMDSTVGYELYRSGQMAFAINAWGPDYLDSNNQLAFLPGETVGLRANWEYEDNPEVADLGKQALGETDPTAREELLVQIQETIKDNSPWLPLAQVGKVTAVRTGISGADYSNAYMIDIYNVTKN